MAHYGNPNKHSNAAKGVESKPSIAIVNSRLIEELNTLSPNVLVPYAQMHPFYTFDFWKKSIKEQKETPKDERLYNRILAEVKRYYLQYYPEYLKLKRKHPMKVSSKAVYESVKNDWKYEITPKTVKFYIARTVYNTLKSKDDKLKFLHYFTIENFGNQYNIEDEEVLRELEAKIDKFLKGKIEYYTLIRQLPKRGRLNEQEERIFWKS